MSATKITQNETNFSKTTDANGWTVYDYGNFKKYCKKGTASDTIGALAWKWLPDIGLPSGMSTIGTNFITSSVMASDAAVCMKCGGVPAGTAVNITAYNPYTGSITYTYNYTIEITTS